MGSRRDRETRHKAAPREDRETRRQAAPWHLPPVERQKIYKRGQHARRSPHTRILPIGPTYRRKSRKDEPTKRENKGWLTESRPHGDVQQDEDGKKGTKGTTKGGKDPERRRVCRMGGFDGGGGS